MYVYGKNVAKELIKNQRKIKKAYLYKGMVDSALESELLSLGVNINYLDKNGLNKIANGNHQGIVLEISDFKYLSETEMFNNFP